MNKPFSKPANTPASPLFRGRIDHSALDAVARTFDETRLPREMRPEDQKGLLLYQLRALVDGMPPDLAEKKPFLGQRDDTAELLAASKEKPVENVETIDWAERIRGRLHNLRNIAHEHSGVAQFGEAWKRDSHAFFKPEHAALLRLGERAYPFYLVQHLVSRIKAIGTDMAKSSLDAKEFGQLRSAMDGAIRQFREAYNPVREAIPLPDKPYFADVDNILTALDAKPKDWGGAYSYLKREVVQDFNEKRFLRSDPMAPGVREESTLSSRPVEEYRDARKKGPLPPVVAGESPLIEVLYTARWAKLARMVNDRLSDRETAKLLNDSSVVANPDGKAVQELVKNCQKTGRTRGG